MAGRARLTFKAAIRNDRTKEVVAALIERMHEVVDESAANIQQLSSQLAPVRTGSLRASIYVTNGTDSDYSQATASARSLNRDVQILDEIDPEFAISPSGGSSGKDSYTVVVGVAAEHGAPQEFGTRFISPRPYLMPATLGEETNFTTNMSQIANG